MTILVLMPLDEKYVYLANALYSALPNNIKDKTLCMPMFMQWAITTKATKTWTEAMFMSLVTVQSAARIATTTKDDLLVIGNCDKKFKFDVVFNMQDAERSEAYKDLFIDKIVEKIDELGPEDTDRDLLSSYISHLYGDKDSKMALRNIVATADFLTAYMGTGVDLDDIKAKYRDKLEFKDESEVGEPDQSNQA